MAAWNAKFGSVTPANARWTLASAASALPSPKGFKITATANDPGSREIDAPMVATWSTSGFKTDSSVGILIGNLNNETASTADNKAQGVQVLVTLKADTAGSLLSEIGNFGKVQGNAVKNVSTTSGVIELSSTLNVNVTPSTGFVVTNSDLHPDESRLDVVLPAETVAAATSTAVSFSRVGWL